MVEYALQPDALQGRRPKKLYRVQLLDWKVEEEGNARCIPIYLVGGKYQGAKTEGLLSHVRTVKKGGK